MRQPLRGLMEDTFTAKETTTEKGKVESINFQIKSAFGEVLNLSSRWSSRVYKSKEEEETVYLQKSSVNGKISFPRGTILRLDENNRCLRFEVIDQETSKTKEGLSNVKLASNSQIVELDLEPDEDLPSFPTYF